MVREVDLALRYFQDAVSKRTYEMLPGMYIFYIMYRVAHMDLDFGGFKKKSPTLLCFHHKNKKYTMYKHKE